MACQMQQDPWHVQLPTRDYPVQACNGIAASASGHTEAGARTGGIGRGRRETCKDATVQL